MKIKNAELGQTVIGKQFKGVGKITHFWLSEANRCYVDIELEKGGICSTPLDLIINYKT